MRNEFIVFSIISILAISLISYFAWTPFLWAFVVFGPIILVGAYDMLQRKHAIMRVFPIFGRGRYVMEFLRPKLYQYFIESDTNGRPLNRVNRSVVYQRAKKELDTIPFGTQMDVYEEGYEWVNHSIGALDAHTLPVNPKVRVGGKDCTQPYDLSLLNVSAMSFGSLSKNAIMALNGGAKIGDFAHNTGEGGISPYHLKFEGDLIYQLGTGYFGARAEDGNFSSEKFKDLMDNTPTVKMIELKLSQGAKPGHGGILPAKKNTEEISKIRGVEKGTDVNSPPFHKAFNTPKGLLEFIQQLRQLSGGRPVGFKLCVGKKSEFIGICKAMIETNILPDFISVDGGEGGTGAAPFEFSNSVGSPFKDGLTFVHDALVGFGLRSEIKLIASGKVMTGFHIYRALALGADACNSARAMMLALGCIQALECNKNSCPTGVATQDPELAAGLVVSDKKQRIANYHEETVEGFVELMAATGITDVKNINRSTVCRRVSMIETKRYDQIFPEIKGSCLLDKSTVPSDWQYDWNAASGDRF